MRCQAEDLIGQGTAHPPNCFSAWRRRNPMILGSKRPSLGHRSEAYSVLVIAGRCLSTYLVGADSRGVGCNRYLPRLGFHLLQLCSFFSMCINACNTCFSRDKDWTTKYQETGLDSIIPAPTEPRFAVDVVVAQALDASRTRG